MYEWGQRSLEQENRQRIAPFKGGGKRLLASDLKCRLSGLFSHPERRGVLQDRGLASSLNR